MLFRKLTLLAVLGGLFFQGLTAQSTARIWNEHLLQSIREDFARPPVHARNLFHVSMAMYDAWAVYDSVAKPYMLGNQIGDFFCPFNGVPQPADLVAARDMAISYAAYRVLFARFQSSPNAYTTLMRLSNQMLSLGYDPNFNSTDYSTGNPAALGNYIGNCITQMGYFDGANEQGGYAATFYKPVNPPLVMANPGNPTVKDVNRWQPLELTSAIDQNGNPIPSIQKFQSPEWGKVVPFALAPADLQLKTRDGNTFFVYHDPGTPPSLDTLAGGGTSDEYEWNYSLVSAWQSHEDPADGVLWDISPASNGNNTWYPNTLAEMHTFYDYENGGDPSLGHAQNPFTGLPYAPQVVPRGDYTRVLAQFWADGPASETPPGHWFAIFNKVMDSPFFVRRFNGQGPLLDPLEYDVKAYFTLGGAVHDAAVTAWGIKGWYDNGRPVEAIRYMAGKGQSSDSTLPHYHPAGLKLRPGLIELVDSTDALAGMNFQNVGKIKLYTFRGPTTITDPATQTVGVGWILAENFWPYQRKTFVTPPFAGYISGHSTFSRSAAETLTLLTGSKYFPGGMGQFKINANSGFLGLEKGPSVDVTLQWATYQDASDQCSLSRIWGGIHPPFDDIPGRKLGMVIGPGAFHKAVSYFYKDLDGDGSYSYEDCNDQDSTIFPGAAEICDGIDQDCNGAADDGLPLNAYFADTDGDGFGNLVDETQTCAATAPTGFVDNSTDCDDQNQDINPAVAEVCDDVDNDCSGAVDDGLPQITYYSDLDEDSFGDPASSSTFCYDIAPFGYADNADDCDDQDADINPSILEICDDLDQNCNGKIDEQLPQNLFYLDADSDGYGSNDPGAVVETCHDFPPDNTYIPETGDCNDSDANINPDAAETCDDVDENCNGQVDEGLPVNTFYVDADHDGYGDLAAPHETCFDSLGLGYSANSLDCNDLDAAFSPAAAEICDLQDNNCDGNVDEGLPTFQYFRDVDGDNFGNPNVAVTICNTTAPSGFTADKTDCDDGNASVYPGAKEVLDSLDNDCNGKIDDIMIATAEPLAGLQARPNPVSTWLTLSGISGEALRVRVMSAGGQVLTEKTLPVQQGQAKLDCSELVPGVYFLSVWESGSERRGVVRVVKI